jgi:hypothetical protein
LPPNDIPANTIVAGSVAENNLPEVHQYLSLGTKLWDQWISLVYGFVLLCPGLSS